MQLPFGSWTETFRKLGYKRVKRKGNLARKRIKGRRAVCEQLERRELLAADLLITQFYSNGTDLLVDYDVVNEAATAFDIDITRAADGVNDDAVVHSARISDAADLAVGSHTLTIAPNFTDVQEDYWLLARIDAGGEVAETDETNNSATFDGGVFQAADGTIHVHGTSGLDDVSVTQPGLLKVRLNGVESTYTASTVTEVHTRTHEGVDDIMGGSGVAKPMWSFGGSGDDDLFGGKKDDYLDGGDGDDYIKGRQGDDELEGRDGDDEIHADAGDDVLRGGDGNDELRGNENDDLLYGGAGADSLYGGQGIDVIYGDDGDDYIEGNEKADTLYGGAGNDTIKGGYGADTIYGEDGDDTIEGNQDADTIYAGAGNDTVDAGYGNDLVYGGSGDDFIEGKQGGDTIFGEDGDDIIDGNSGTNTLDGGKGIDTIDGVTDTNTAPTGDVANLAADEDTLPLVIDLADAFEDAEHLDSELTFTVVSNGNPTLVTSAIASGTDLIVTVAADASGTADLTVRAEDPLNLYSEDTFTLTINAVNDAPIVIGPTPVNVTADEDDNPPTEVDLYAIFDDVDNDDTELSFQIISNDNAALFTSVVIAGGALVLTHANNKHGQANIVLRATDPGGLSADVTLAVVVNPINDVPTTSGIADVNVNEDAADTVIDLFAAFADVEDADEDLTYTIQDNSDPSLFSSTSIDGLAGTLTLSYAANANGSSDIIIRATDLGGEHVDATFTVNVAAVNDQPTTSGIADVLVAQGTGSTVVDLSNAFDDVEDSGSLTYSIVDNTDPTLFVSLDADDAAQTLTLFYDLSVAGTSDVTVRATDSGGLFVDTTFTVTVNSAPQAVGLANFAVDEDAPSTLIDLVQYFNDIEDGAENLTYEIVSNSNPGVVIDSLDGSELTLGYETDAYGTATLVVRATDSGGLYTESTVLVEVRSVNDAPEIGSLLDGPDPAIEGADLTLQLDSLTDDATGLSVDFYRDADGDGQLNAAVDQHLGTDADVTGGWSITVSTAGFGTGHQTYFAKATDADGATSDIAMSVGSVGLVGILDNAHPGYSETGTSWTDGTSNDSFDGGHREHAAGTGANTATWDFTGLPVALHRVSVTWAADAQNATNAPFKVYDGTTLLGTFLVDQTQAPASLEEGGQWWHDLGTFEITSGAITVELSDDADGIVIADAVRAQDPPKIGYLGTDRAEVTEGVPLLLTAYDVVPGEEGGVVAGVNFYLDENDDGMHDPTELIGAGTVDENNWKFEFDTDGEVGNSQKFIAVAYDNAMPPNEGTAAVSAAVNIVADVNDANLVAHWKFNETSGTTVNDSQGSHTGTLHNSINTQRDGFTANGLVFDGVNDYVQVADPVNPDGDFSVSAWARIDGGGRKFRAIVSSRNAVGTVSEGYILYVQPNGTLSFWTGDGTLPWEMLTTSAAMPFGEWIRVTATFDSASESSGVHTGTKTLTVHDADGNVLVDLSTTSAYKPNTAHGLRIGAGANEEAVPQFYFNGAIDDVRVYSDALDSAEILQLVDTPANDAPEITSGRVPTILVPVVGIADGHSVHQVTAEDDNGDDLLFEITDRDDGGIFDINSDTGEVFVPAASAWEAAPGTYELTVKVSDGGAPDLFTTAQITIEAADLADGLVSHWQFDGMDDTATDSAGTNDGTLTNGPVRFGGLTGKAIDFDGVNDYIQVSDPVNPDGDFSVSAWARIDGGGGAFRAIVSSRNAVGTVSEGYILYVQPNGTLSFWTGDGTLPWEMLTTSAAMPFGEWIRVTATFDSASESSGVHTGTKTLTVHDHVGNLIVNLSTTSAYKPNTAHDLRIGAGANEEAVPQFYFNGAIDDVRVYDRVLTGDEAQTLTEIENIAPVIEDQSFAVFTDSADGDLVGTVNATDVNLNETLTYAITAGGPAGGFDIDNQGKLTIADAAALDLENNPLYTLTVRVTDAGNLFDEATITVEAGDVTAGLVAHWKLDDGAGTTAEDSVGTSDGTLTNGPAWTTGHVGGGTDFDGIDDYIQVADPVNPDGDFSVSAWARIDGGSGYRTIVSSREAVSTISEGHILYVTPDNRISFWTGDGSLPWESLNSAATMPSGQWLRVTATFDSESVAGGVHTGTKTLTVYDDAGNLLASESVTSRYKPNTAHGLRIGAGANEETIPQFYFNGAIDDVRVYEQALSTNDAAILAGAPPRIANLSLQSASIAGSSVDATVDVVDPSGNTFVDVLFFLDLDQDGTLDADEWSFVDTTPADGGSAVIDTAVAGSNGTALAAGDYSIVAQGRNGTSIVSELSGVLKVTDDYIILDDGDPGYSEYGSGWNSGSFDAGSAYDDDYRTAYFPQGTNIAVWNATDLPAGTFDVYVSYVDAANHISAASYRVYTDSPDGNGNLANHTKVGEKFVDQTTPVAADLVDGTQNWERIGRATVAAGGQLSVELDAGGSIGRWAVADGVRLQRIDEVQGVVHDFSLHNGAAGATPRAIDLNAAFANVVGLTGDLTFSITGNSNPAVLESAVIDNANGFLTVVASETLGSTSLTISVDDDDADTDADASATFTITVNDNLVQNGSFEQIVTPNPWNYIHAIPEWTLESGPNFELQKNLLQTSADGSQYLELDAHPLPGSTTISQTVNTVAGATYQLRFAFSGRPGTSTAHNHLGLDLLDVDAAGAETAINFTLLDEATGAAVTNNQPNLPGNSGWRYYTTTFLATSPSTKLQFADLGPSDTYGGFVDDVSVVRQAPVVSIRVDTTEIDETGGTAIFTVERDVATLDSLDVDLFLSGDALLDVDYTFTGVTFTDDFATIEIPAGQTSASFTLTGQDDFEAELDEIAAVDILFGTPDYMAPLADEDAFAEVTITDDEQGVSISVDRDFIDEDPNEDTTATFTVSRTGTNDTDLDVYLSFAGDATLGTDYTLGSDVMFDALLGKYFVTIHTNQSDPLTTTFTITTSDDSDLETTEFIEVEVDYDEPSAGYTTPFAGHTSVDCGINDDDNPKPTLTIGSVDEDYKLSTGAILFRNSDFSKKQLIIGPQQEPGFDQFVPDYLAADDDDPTLDRIDPEYLSDFVSAKVELPPGMRTTHAIQFKYDDDKIRLWTFENWAGTFDQAGDLGGQPVYVIQDGDAAFTAADDRLDFWIEGIGTSTEFAEDHLTVNALVAVADETLFNSSDRVDYTIIETGLAVDGNRDQTIDFANNHDRQLTFWYNNDRETTKGKYETEIFDITSDPRDFSDEKIEHRRDLEDLATLGVIFDELLAANAFEPFGSQATPDGRYKVEQDLWLENHGNDTAIRLFRSTNPQDDVFRHVSNEKTARLQTSESGQNQSIGRAGNLDDVEWEANLTGDLRTGYTSYLFEGITEFVSGTPANSDTFKIVQETVVTYSDDSTVKKQHVVDLTLRDIQDFYFRYDMNPSDGTQDLRKNLDVKHLPDAEQTHASQVANTAFLSGNDNVVSVHGWNESEKLEHEEKKEFSETMYKRLYWQGFRGDFYAFNWPTFVDGDGFTEGVTDVLDLTYNASEYVAFRSGRALKNFLAQFQDADQQNFDGDVHLMAHSLGNIMAGEALRQWRTDDTLNDAHAVKTYIAMNAAVSAGAYGDDSVDLLSTFTLEGPNLYLEFGVTEETEAPLFLGKTVDTDAAKLQENHNKVSEIGKDAEKWINLYLPNDFATNPSWRANNAIKGDVEQVLGDWDYFYDHNILPLGLGKGFWRFDGSFDFPENAVRLDVGDALYVQGEGNSPTLKGYEAIAFLSQSTSFTLGNKAIPWWFHTNTDVNTWLMDDATIGGSQNHSFQFNYDASFTFDYWKHVKEETAFTSTF